jgi:hypothetical protein
MAVVAGADYYQLSRSQKIPRGLVSDPPNYPRCVTVLESAAAGSPSAGAKPGGTELLGKCQQIYQAVKAQAVGFLVYAQWTIGMAREAGLTATKQEALQLYRQVKVRFTPAILAGKRWSLSDALFLLKLNVLGQKALKKFEAGGPQASARLATAEERWTAKTTCRAGYVVQYCREHKGGANDASTPAPSVLMEQVAKIVTGRCVNRAACGKV